MRQWVGPVILGSAVSVATTVVSCRQIVGIHDNPTGEPTRACALPYGTNTCADCVLANCCSESNACEADPVCAPYESCLGNCQGDPACRSQCVIDFPSGTVASVAPLSACLASKCESECGLVCGGLAAYQTPPGAAAACQGCLVKNACADARTCASSVDCEAVFQQCVLACPTVNCVNACEIAHGALTAAGGYPDGGPFTSFIHDWSGVCGTACGSGTYWSCVGHVGWPAPKSPAVTVVYQGWDYVSHGFIPGLDVSVCSLLDPDCARPLASGRTDATGTAVMRLQNAPDAFGLGLNGYFEVTSPDMSYVPNIVYWGYPLSEANAPSPAGGGPNWNVTPAEYQGLAAFLGVTLDPKRGTIVAVVVDCLLDNAPGVQVSLDVRDQAIGEFYGFNNPKATATDQTGLAIFTNVPAGTVHLTATPLAIRKPSSHVAVQVRAGWITGPTLLPTP